MNSTRFWNKIPQLINSMRLHMLAHGKGDLEYEPLHLQVTPSQVNPAVAALKAAQQRKNRTGQPTMLPETFRFVLEQVPAIRTIEFTGHTDPFENPHLLEMVNMATQFNGAESTIVTNGLILESYIDPILKSSLKTLLVKIYAHRPSAYAALSGRPAVDFVPIHRTVERLVAHKKALGSAVEVDLCMAVDVHYLTAIPDMIAYARQLGVNGLHLDNIVAHNRGVSMDRVLYADRPAVIRIIDDYKEQYAALEDLVIHWPTLLKADMSTHRHCLDPFLTLSVDAECNVSACSQKQLMKGPVRKIWEEDFWNSELFTWLRNVHGRERKNSEPVPKACQNCLRNMPQPGGLNQRPAKTPPPA